MKNLLVGINTKFIHSNLAIRYIAKYATLRGEKVEFVEYTINQQIDYIVREIMLQDPDFVTFSCYLWNIDMILNIARTLRQLKPEMHIALGGPEVSYNAISMLKEHACLDTIMQGEGECTYYEMIRKNIEQKYPRLKGIEGITYRDRETGKIVENPVRMPMAMDDVPFPYEDELEGFEHRIIYYETSRGCPFHCGYCISSIEKGVRFRSKEKVEKELQFFLERNVMQVKLVDRTFNAKKSHTFAIMDYIIANDNGVTNFHFEVSPDLIDEAFIYRLKKARKGLFQLEMGIQSMNQETLKEIRRKNNENRINEAVASIHSLRNTHMHLDLIAGLPLEDFASFGRSFDYVYHLQPDQLQLGFLKLLKGSNLYKRAEELGLIYRSYAPYEILKTPAISYQELEELKMIEEMVELFYNSHQFVFSITYYEKFFKTPFEMFGYIAKKWMEVGNHHRKLNRQDNYNFFYEVVKEKEDTLLIELVKLDYGSSEKPKKSLPWMEVMFIEGKTQRSILDRANEKGLLGDMYETYTTKQLGRMLYIDVYSDEMVEYLTSIASDYGNLVIEKSIKVEEIEGNILLIRYDKRDFISHHGMTYVL